MNQGQSKQTRREMVAAGASLLAAPIVAAISPAAGAEPNAQPASFTTARPMRNPLTEYPKPPFKRQHQEPPRLACEMERPPDHGEKSYKGSGHRAQGADYGR